MKIVNYKILIGLFITLLLLVLVKNAFSQIIQIKQEGSVVEKLKKELSQERKRNQYLQEQLKYVQTNQFIEEKARDTLGYIQNGEIVVRQSIPAASVVKEDALTPAPYWKQWIELFL